MQDPPQQSVHPQNTMPCDLNLEGSAVTYPQEIQGFLPPHRMQGARLHGWQPQSTVSDDPYFIASGVSTHTHSTVNLGSHPPHETLRSPQYGFHPQGASPSYLNLQFSGPVTSSLTQSPVTSGHFYPYGNYPRAPWQPRSTIAGYPYPRCCLPLRGMQDPPQQSVHPQNTMPCDLNLEGSAVTYPQEIQGFLPPHRMQGARLHGWQPQSTQGASPSYLNLQFSGPVTSSLTQSPVTSGHFYPYGNYPRAPLQSASPGDPHLSEHVAPSVTHPPVIPGHFYPYGNHLRAPLQAPQPQSASPGDPHLSGPMSSVIPR